MTQSQLAAALGRMAKGKKKTITPDDQNDAIRAQVSAELPRPAGGFESAADEDAWKAAQEKRFLELCRV